MFGKFQGMLKLNASSNVVKEALRNTSIGSAEFDVETLASRLVAMLYSTKPELFDGKMGKRPHSVPTAVASLAQGLRERPAGFNESIDASMFLALGSLLLSASANSKAYGFSNYDVPLLKLGEEVYLEYEGQHRSRTDKIVGSLGL